MTERNRTAVPAPSTDPVYGNRCADSLREDGKHSWRFDGDDPYIVCSYCGERRDALTGTRIGGVS